MSADTSQAEESITSLPLWAPTVLVEYAPAGWVRRFPRVGECFGGGLFAAKSCCVVPQSSCMPASYARVLPCAMSACPYLHRTMTRGPNKGKGRAASGWVPHLPSTLPEA
jgi:hypothetical protein